ncbi:MAG: ABC transporter substrate-binding protein, partial [Rhodanobacteraceae bacterium]
SDYAFHNDVAHQWKIYDVIIEGISYITLYRSQVNSQIDKDGIDGVIKRLQTQGLIDISQ